MAKSRSDFKLRFSVFLVIISEPRFAGDAALFANLFGQFRQELQDVVDDADVRHLENGGFGILVDGNDERVALHSGQVLERSADAAGQVNLGPHGLAGRADLTRLRQPLGIDDRTRAADDRAHRFGQLLRDGDIVLLLDAAADGNQYRLLGDIDVAGFGNDRRQIPPPRRQRSHFGGLVDDWSAGGNALDRLERARPQIQHRAGREVAANVRADLAAELLANRLSACRLRSRRYPGHRRHMPRSA